MVAQQDLYRALQRISLYMFKGCVLLAGFFYLFLADVFAQNARITSFEARPSCIESKGVWREFGNGCVDNCQAKLDKFSICTQALTYGCDCGVNRCWNGDSCVAMKDYKKIFDEEREKEKKILDEAKKKRRDVSAENRRIIINNLTKKAVGDSDQALNNPPANSQPVQIQNYQQPPQPGSVVNAPVTQTTPLVPLPNNQISDLVTNTQNQQTSNQNNSANKQSDQNSSSDQVIDDSLIPPFFKQKQKASQSSSAQQDKGSTASTKSSSTANSGLPELPVIPIP